MAPPSGTVTPQGESMRIVLCGSMSAMPTMEQLQDELATDGIDALVPRPDSHYATHLTSAVAAQVKRKASYEHIRKIKDSKTRGILVVNIDREGVRDYIGPNSFAEIVIAFAEGREIYLFQGMPSIYREELIAWGAQCLYGDLKALKTCLRAPVNAHSTSDL
jgi:hypothetical protein